MTDISPSGSLKGYSFKEWISRNKSDIKLLISIIGGVAAFAITSYLPIGWQVSLSGLVTVLVRLGLDAFDFWVSNVKL